jgi:hypothetical protein
MIIWWDCVKTVSEPNLNKSEFRSDVVKLFLHLLCSKLAVNWWYAQYMSVNMQDFSFEISLQISYNWCHNVGLELRSYNWCHSVGLELRWNTFMISFDLKVLSSSKCFHHFHNMCKGGIWVLSGTCSVGAYVGSECGSIAWTPSWREGVLK